MSLDRPTFEKKVDVLERNKLYAWIALAMLVGGPVLLLLAIAGVFPGGIFGLHIGAVGLAMGIASQRRNIRPKRNRRGVRADREGVWKDGVLVVPRAEIEDGFFQPRPGRVLGDKSSYGSSVRLVGARRRVLFEAETDEREALDLLHALGLDPGSKRAEFNGSSPLFATFARNLLTTFGFIGVAFLLTFTLASLGLASGPLPLLVAPLLFGGMIPSKIAVGVDGILVRWLWQKKFIPMSQIARVDRQDDRVIVLTLVDGREERIYTSMSGRHRSRRSRFPAEHRDAVLARINEALATFRARGPAADVSALVGKGTRTRAEWLLALAKLRNSEGGYREAVVREEDLWRVVEDPSAPEDARGGAAMLLCPGLDDAGKARVRVAAEASASPRLRVALDTAASDAKEEELASALDQLVEEDHLDPRRAS